MCVYSNNFGTLFDIYCCRANVCIKQIKFCHIPREYVWWHESKPMHTPLKNATYPNQLILLWKRRLHLMSMYLEHIRTRTIDIFPHLLCFRKSRRYPKWKRLVIVFAVMGCQSIDLCICEWHPFYVGHKKYQGLQYLQKCNCII